LVAGNDDAGSAQRIELPGVVGEDAERRRDAEQAAGGDDLVVAPLVVTEPEALVGLEGGQSVAARLHQHAVARLGREAGTAPLLRQVEEDTASRAGDGAEGGVELLGAVAIAGAVDLAGDARRVHAGEQRCAAAEAADGHREGGVPRRQVVEAVDPEPAVDGVEPLRVEREQGPLHGGRHRALRGSCFCVFMTWK
jgi:hypothetical protein